MQHGDLQNDRWSRFSLTEQMANIGSEVLRAMKWKAKGNKGYSDAANNRALELIDLTIASRSSVSELKEICRVRELWLDFYLGDNQYHQTEEQWQKYFFAFNWAAQLTKRL